MAKVIYTNKLATKEQIHEFWPQVSSSQDIAQILIANGVLPEGYYGQLSQYVSKLEAQQGDKHSGNQSEAAASNETEPSTEVDPSDGAATSHESDTTDSPNVSSTTAQPSTEQPSPPPETASQDEPSEVIHNEIPQSEPDDELEVLDVLASNDIFYGSSPKVANVETSDVLVQTQYSDDLTQRTLAKGVADPELSQNHTEKTISPQAPASTEEPVEVIEDGLPSVFHGQRGGGELPFRPIESVNEDCSLFQILELARRVGASDVHLSVNNPVIFRQFSRLVNFSEFKLTQAQIEAIILKDIPSAQLEDFYSVGDYEMVLTVQGAGRFRSTLMAQRSGWDFAARVIANEIMPFEQLGLPESCEGLTKWAQGLVLVTGPVGCGKTTSLSTLVQMVNESRKDHIITVESPVEMVYPSSTCQMTQREVGTHTLSPANALKGALRQDPDILVVSELRDLETIELAVSAAETGHLVFGTMNTNNAARTITRLVDSFPPDEQEIIRSMISESLRGVISQQLLPLKDGTGVIPAFEVLLVTAPVANLIRKNEIHQLESAMITGKSAGMVLLDESLQKLIDDDLVDGKECYYRANNPKNFEKYLKGAE